MHLQALPDPSSARIQRDGGILDFIWRSPREQHVVWELLFRRPVIATTARDLELSSCITGDRQYISSDITGSLWFFGGCVSPLDARNASPRARKSTQSRTNLLRAGGRKVWRYWSVIRPNSSRSGSVETASVQLKRSPARTCASIPRCVLSPACCAKVLRLSAPALWANSRRHYPGANR